MVRETGTINLSHSLSRPRIIRTKGMIQKVKKRMKRKKRVSIGKLAGELGISNGSVVRILKQDLGCRSYKKRVEPTLTDFEGTLRILFSDEKIFDLDGMYNAQNDRI